MSEFEIERKYLIKKPEIAKIEKEVKVEKVLITQTYLLSENETERRVRRKIVGDKKSFFYTEKITISSIKRIENERKIMETEYNELLKEKDPLLHTINKTRYVFIFKNQKFEMDFYEFSDEYAILEIEIREENEKIMLPDFIAIISDVTEDREFKNKSLSKTGKLPIDKYI